MADQLDLLRGLADDLRHESRAAQDVGLSEMAFAIYGVLDEDSVGSGEYDPDRKELATRVEETLEPYATMVDWTAKEDLQRRMRRDVKRVLRDSGMPEAEVQKVTLGIIDLAKARRGK